MKHELIMENWRKFVTEVEETKDYGELYLFEGDTVQKVSFYDRLMSLNEGENDFDILFEQWEKSANYELDRLDEVDWKALKSNPVLYLSSQVYLMVAKAKDKILKHIGKIKAILTRAGGFLDKFKEKNPKLYKVGSLAIKVAIALVAVTAISSLMGGDAAMAADLTASASPVEAYAQKVLANADQLEALGEMLKTAESPEQQQLGADLIELAQSGENMSAREVADKFEGLSTVQLENFIEKGVRVLAQADANAAEAAEQALNAAGDAAPQVTDYNRGSAPLQAMHTLGQLATGNEDAVQKLIDLQSVPGAPDAIQGVDFESLSRDEILDLIQQVRDEADIHGPGDSNDPPPAGSLHSDSTTGIGSRIRSRLGR